MIYNNILRSPDRLQVITDDKIFDYENINDFNYLSISLKENLKISLAKNNLKIKYLKLFWDGKTDTDTICLGDAWERGYGDLEWLPINKPRHMPWYFFITDKETTVGIGVKVRPAAICSWECSPDNIALTMDIRCGGMGVDLNDRSLECCEIITKEYQGISAFEATCRFPRNMCDDPIFPEKPVYGSNNWYYAYGNITEESVIEDTEYISELTKGLMNRPYMVIDDGWQKNRNARGPFVPNEKFSDMKKLAEKISGYDVIPGIWIRLLQNDDGVPEHMQLQRPNAENIYDPTVPEAMDEIIKDTKRMSGWGYKLLKHDYSTFDLFGKYGFSITDKMTDDGWSFYDKTKTSAEVIINLYRQIKKAFKGGIIIGCNCIGHLCAGIHEVYRTGDDTSGKEWSRTLKMGVNTLVFRMGQHKAFYDVDADCIGITDMIAWDDNKKFLELLAKSGTPLFMSSKKGVANPEQVEAIKEAMARSSKQEDVLIPLDWFEKRIPEKYLLNGELIEFEF
ncbi:alpha-galactosidase [Eubacteriales bacterium OttesenSCG-928-G02]|nr:alpha-galactosidase [Eubacteriales bacterium OttesenSCG-928-G02]